MAAAVKTAQAQTRLRSSYRRPSPSPVFTYIRQPDGSWRCAGCSQERGHGHEDGCGEEA